MQKEVKFVSSQDKKGKEVLKKLKEDILVNPKIKSILARLKDK